MAAEWTVAFSLHYECRMKPILILYATREGHTHHIAEHIAGLLRDQGFPVEPRNVKECSEVFDLAGYSAAILAASVHMGEHEREMIAFVKRHREALDSLPSAFLSVSLSEAGVEDRTASEDKREQAKEDVERMLATFFEETGWHPARVTPVAGALLFTKYGLILRFIMKRIARKAGSSTDTSRDHVFTDWDGLERFVNEFVPLLPTSDQSI